MPVMAGRKARHEELYAIGRFEFDRSFSLASGRKRS